MHPEGAGMQECHHCQIQDHIRHRIEQVGNPAHPELKPVQQLVSSGKFRNLLRFLPKCPQDPYPGEILPGGSRHAVQVALHLPVHGNRHQNDGEDHCQQHGYRHSKHQRPGHINGKGHHHSAKHHKGRPEQQAQGQIHPILQLIHIAGHAGNHGSGAQGVDLPVRQPLNMGKQRAPQPGGKTGSRLRRKILGCYGANQSHHSQKRQKAAPLQNVPVIPAGNAHIDDGRHDQRHKQLKQRLQQLKQRTQHTLFPVRFQINQQSFHTFHLPMGSFVPPLPKFYLIFFHCVWKVM